MGQTGNHIVVDWGAGWEPVDPAGPLEAELRKELAASHPLAGMQPIVFGRCRSCDDVVVALAHVPPEPELAVVHLTWAGGREKPGFPYFERLTTPEFLRRFLRGGEHL